MDLFLEILDPVEMLLRVYSLLLDHRHFDVVMPDARVGEFCVEDPADELLVNFFQSLEEEGFFEVPGFVFKIESRK